MLAIKSEPRIYITEIAAVAKEKLHMTSFTPPHSPVGEFGKPSHFGGHQPSANETPEQLIERLYTAIEILVSSASEQHRTRNCIAESNELLPANGNNITRLITNEFFFYTSKPLTLKQFQILQQKIVDLAKNQPENFHLVLGTFAVLTPDKKVMNVLPQIECGSNPRISLIVKNHPSSIDPEYTYYPNIDNNHNITNYKIIINNQECQFTFDNIIQCKTAGGALFYSCIDICADHFYGVAKKHLNAKLKNYKPHHNEKIATQLSHVVISNVNDIYREQSLGDVTHVDPSHTHNGCKHNATMHKLPMNNNGDIGFGTPVYMYLVDLVPCNDLSLTNAIENGHFEIVKILLESGVDPNKPDWRGVTPLGLADLLNDTETKQLLFNKGAVLSEDDPLLKPNKLMYAVEINNINVLKLLLQNNFKPNDLDYKYETLLHIAASHGNYEMAKILLKYKPEVPCVSAEIPLLIAVKAGNKVQVEYLLHNNINPNSFNYHTGVTPLMQAANDGNIQIMQVLLNCKRETNVHIGDYNGYRALHFAAKNGHLKVVQLLLQHGVNSCQKTNDGLTPLSIAEANGHYDIAICLIDSALSMSAYAQSKGDDQVALEIAKQAKKMSIDLIELIENSATASINTKDAASKINLKAENYISQLITEHYDDKQVLSYAAISKLFGDRPIHKPKNNQSDIPTVAPPDKQKLQVKKPSEKEKASQVEDIMEHEAEQYRPKFSK